MRVVVFHESGLLCVLCVLCVLLSLYWLPGKPLIRIRYHMRVPTALAGLLRFVLPVSVHAWAFIASPLVGSACSLGVSETVHGMPWPGANYE